MHRHVYPPAIVLHCSSYRRTGQCAFNAFGAL